MLTQVVFSTFLIVLTIAGDIKPATLGEAEDAVSQAYGRYFDAVRSSKGLSAAEQKKLYKQIVEPAESGLGQYVHDKQMEGIKQNFKIISDPAKVPKYNGPNDIELPKEIEGRLDEILNSMKDASNPLYKKKKVMVEKTVNGKKTKIEKDELVPVEPDPGPVLDGSGVPKEVEFRGKRGGAKKIIKPNATPEPVINSVPHAGDNVDVIEFKWRGILFRTWTNSLYLKKLIYSFTHSRKSLRRNASGYYEMNAHSGL